MRATVMYGAGDVRVEDVPDAHLIEATDALVRVTRAGICGSDLWPYRSMEPTDSGRRMGHEFIGVLEAVGDDVQTIEAGGGQSSYTYEPFGKTTASGAASSNTFQFTGRENDGTGLHYFRARYYSPALQRFLSEDPQMNARDVKRFIYVGNSPPTYTDPLGLFAIPSPIPGAVGEIPRRIGQTAHDAWSSTLSAGEAFDRYKVNFALGVGAAGCALAFPGLVPTVCSRLALAALGANMFASLGVNGRKENWNRFAIDTAVQLGFFGASRLAVRAVTPFYMPSARDRRLATRSLPTIALYLKYTTQRAADYVDRGGGS